MNKTEIDKKKIEELLPHREPMLLIDKLTNIVHLKSATAIMYVKKDGFYVQGHFPGQPVMPGVLIVEAFGQAAAALTAYGIDPKEYKNKLVYLMSVDKAKFRSPVIPDWPPIETLSPIFELPAKPTWPAIIQLDPIFTLWAIWTWLSKYVFLPITVSSIGGQAGISGHLKIGNNVKIGGGSGVVKDIKDNQIVMGYPAVSIKEFLKKNKWIKQK